MKKNFLKKLSFVLALAMIVSVIAPAAGVFAAAKLTLNSTNKTLHLSGEPGSNKYNFNIDGKKEKGWKYNWTSSNDDVAEVNASNGVATATGIGSAKVTVVIKDSKGAEVQKISAKVTVKDNIKTVKVANAPDKALAVDATYDFNRSFVTLSGATDKTTAITRWSVENTDKATITENDGMFKASEAGKYTVVARSFQSKAKYEAWKTSKDASLLLDDDSVEVTVKASVKETKQTELTKFNVIFDSNMSKAGLNKDSAKVFKVVNGIEISTGAEKIKALSLDGTGKVATVEMFAEFSQETDYKFAFNDLTGTFKSAKVDLSKVASIEFKDMRVNIVEPSKFLGNVVGKNADGVVIFTSNGDTDNASQSQKEFNAHLSFELAKDADPTKVYFYGDNVYVNTKGYATTATAKFNYYYFNDVSKKVEPISLTDAALIEGVELNNVIVSTSLSFAVTATSRPADWEGKWGVGPFKVAADDQSLKIYARYRDQKNPNSWDAWKDGDTRFKYQSVNTDKAMVLGTNVYPIAEGNVTILVLDTLNNDMVVGSFELAITATRGVLSAVADPAYVQVSNNHWWGADIQWPVTWINVKDTMNEAAHFSRLSVNDAAIQKISGPEDLQVATKVLTEDWNRGKIEVKVHTKDKKAGNYQYKIPVVYTDTLGKSKTTDVYINIVVREANTADTNEAKTWQLDVSKTSFEVKDNVDKQVLNYVVAGYNQYGMKVTELPEDQYALTVIKQDNGVSAPASLVTKKNFTFIDITGKSLLPVEKGTYIITAKAIGANNPTGKYDGQAIGVKTFTLTDATTLDFRIDNRVVKSNTAIQIAKDAFTFFWSGNDCGDEVDSVTYITANGTAQTVTRDNPGAAVSAGTILITEVKYRHNKWNGNYIVNTVNPKTTIEVR